LISLVGLPGSGKSSVGRQLARRLQLPFIDSDQYIQERLGCSIRDYFEQEGEEKSRECESAALNDLTRSGLGVLATGGGSVIRADNRRVLRERTQVVYLRSTPEEVFRRLRYDKKRPLLQVSDPLQQIRKLFEERDPLYREVAHFSIETGRPSVGTLVNMILMQLELADTVQDAVSVDIVTVVKDLNVQ